MVPSVADAEAFQRSKIEIFTPGGESASNVGNLNYADLEHLRKTQRSHFFFDEITPIVVVISSALSETSMGACLGLSHLTVSAHLIAFSPQQDQAPQSGKQDPSVKVALGAITPDLSTATCIHSVSTDVTTAIYTGELHLHHPERQVIRPSVHFAASLLFEQPSTSEPDPLDDYLPSGVPLSANILSPLLASPAFAGTNLNLPASRLNRVVPLSAVPVVEARPVRGASQRYTIGPALLLRTSRTLFPDQVYLSVDTQVPIHSKSAVSLQKAEARLPSSEVEALTTVALPTSLRPGDRTTFVFKTDADAGASIAQYRLTAGLTTSQGTRINLLIRRNLNAPPGAKVPTRERVKHWSTPKGTSRPSSTITRPAESGEVVRRGLKLTITAPHTVRVGDTFSVKFFVVNNGLKKRRLSILGPASAGPSKSAGRSSWIAGGSNPTKNRREDEFDRGNIASVVTDSKDLYAQITGLKQADRRRSAHLGLIPTSKPPGRRAEIVTLDPEIRLGTLQPGACYEISMRIQALSVGVVSIEGMVVADLDSRETCLIGEGWEGICYDGEQQPDVSGLAKSVASVSQSGVGDVLIPDIENPTAEDRIRSDREAVEVDNG
ncbi:hypothetical protein CAC42_7756 [Sphaceloma murrayae]|uniref:Trafficking protein particle complex II-specific subunit 65 IgD3 domain-containing protein n=1 Tax=Sphaceloma murrayae TaxID=2082308 RepID=A0A2K1QXP5_9PEZI|nr:hypothetical protein CAC42_7756 [Sphaceloma murrayae]